MIPEYVAWLRQVNAVLQKTHSIKTDDVWQADWRFDWHRSWVAGCRPYEAAEDAIAELQDRGILDEVARTARR